ncbi:MAG: ABC transporter ATP-binding protein/permease [Erysipelotrichaceae bacterium]|nr:ABC transporter ATP-binding protein/permease [Erysipelotrichaceae bacterium]
MRKLLIYLKPYRGKIALATLLMAVSALCDLLLPTLMSDVLDRGVYGAAETDTFSYILSTGAWMLALSVLSLTCVAGGYWVVYHVVSGYTWSLRSALFHKVHTMTLEEVGRIGPSNLVTRSTHDVGTLNWIISALCGGILIIPLMFIGGVVLCVRKDVRLSLIVLAAVPLLIGMVLTMSRKIEHLWEVSDEYCDKQNDLVRQRLRGIRVIRAFDRELQAHEKITEATHIMADNIIRANVRMEIIDPLVFFVLNTAALLVVYLGGLRLERGSGLSAGDIFAIVQYISVIMNAIVAVSYDIVMVPHIRVAVRRLSQITESTGLEDDRPAEGLVFSGNIDVDHVSFTYPGSSLSALSDIDMHIKAGQWISIIGGTGSGKSTLAELLLDFRRPSEGAVCFDGRSTKELSPKDVRNNVSCALQKSMLYAGTIAENLRMGKPDATDEELWDALELAQLADFVKEKPEGLNFKLEQAAANISGGQKQRLAIARAILKDASIYIFDDSFSALDFLTEAAVRKALNEKLAGKTRIVITQRVVSAMHSDMIYVLADGALVGVGRHEELLESCDIYREIYLSQTGGEVA